MWLKGGLMLLPSLAHLLLFQGVNDPSLSKVTFWWLILPPK